MALQEILGALRAFQQDQIEEKQATRSQLKEENVLAAQGMDSGKEKGQPTATAAAAVKPAVNSGGRGGGFSGPSRPPGGRNRGGWRGGGNVREIFLILFANSVTDKAMVRGAAIN